MKLTILGATGRTGLQVVRQALERGYDLSVLARAPGRLGEYRGQVKIVEGSAADAVRLREAVAGSNAVISALGPVRGSPADLMRQAARAVVAAMREARVRRLVWLAGAVVEAPGDCPKLIDKLIFGIMRVGAGSVVSDSAAAVEVIKDSGLDWTIVRVPRLTSAPGSGRYQVGMVGYQGMRMRIPREDAARFILDCVGAKRFYGKMPMVSSGVVRVKK